MSSDCLFCKIVAKQIPAKIEFEDDRVVVFRDIHPVAPQHLLIIPREHFVGLADAMPHHEALLGHALLVAAKLAKDLGFSDDGFRTVLNTGANAGQSVFHLHVHLLAGRNFAWPPG